MYMDLAIALASAPGLPIVTVPMGGLGDDARVIYSDEGEEDGAFPILVVRASTMPQGLSFEGIITLASCARDLTKEDYEIDRHEWGRGCCWLQAASGAPGVPGVERLNRCPATDATNYQQLKNL